LENFVNLIINQKIILFRNLTFIVLEAVEVEVVILEEVLIVLVVVDSMGEIEVRQLVETLFNK
jgi:hypothetical protein